MARDDEILTVNEAAAYLKLHPKTVYRLVKKGEIPAQRVGGAWRLYRARLRRWMEGRDQPQTATAADADVTISGSSESRGENESS